jgi:hypothetical protein
VTTLTLRRVKNSPLTNDEVDDNFQALSNGLAAKESSANKGVANGYASLDGGGKVPLLQLPDGIGGGAIGNLDGGDADTGYGSLTTIDGGNA